MYRATLVKGKTYDIGPYHFNIKEFPMVSQIVPSEIAKKLEQTRRFKVVEIDESKSIIEMVKKPEVIKPKVIESKIIEPEIFVLIDWIEEATGYGNIAKKLLKKYSGTIKYVQKGPEFKDNLDLKDVPAESYVIQLTTPNCFRDLDNVKKRIGFTMFETTKIPPDWAKICNKTLDILIVPSKENKKVFKNCGIDIPIKVIPLWVDNCYKYYDRPKRKIFTFLFVGGVDDHNRKGWYELQKAFKQEFKKEKDVKLIFKCLFINIHNEMALQIMEDDRISFIKGKFKNQELYELYKQVDCFMFPTHGEGFGLPPLEAMATGLPTIVTDWMGCKEFVDDKICYPLKVKKLEEALFPDTYGDVGDWAYINIKELRKQMRYVYEHQKEAKQKGKLAAKVVNKRYRFKHFTEALEKVVNFVEPEPVSIIIPVWNCLKYLKNCVKSVIKHTNNYELIIIDNGSNKQTKKYIKSLDNARVITNKENKGFAYACNQGIKSAQYKYFCLLNSDTKVTSGWLAKLMKGFDRPNAGIVGPTTTYCQASQGLLNVEPDNMFFDKTIKLSSKLKEGYRAIDDLQGFCYLISKEVVDKIGVFNWRTYSIGGVEEVDYNDRAIRAGFKLYWVKESFVHHYRHKTFDESGIDRQAIMKEGLEIFRGKKNQDLFVKNDVKAIVDGEPEKVIMTANIGGVDNPIERHFDNPEFRHVMFTDDRDVKSSFWDVKYIKRKFKDARKEARMYKWLPHKLFPDIQYSVWVDSNIIIMSDISELIKLYLADADIALLRHNMRNCIYAEGEACIFGELDNIRTIEAQMKRYRAEGYPANNGLHQTRVILRRHTKEINALNEAVWLGIKNGSIRDQLCFDYMAWKMGVKVNDIPGLPEVYSVIDNVTIDNANNHFAVIWHIKKNREYRQEMEYED